MSRYTVRRVPGFSEMHMVRDNDAGAIDRGGVDRGEGPWYLSAADAVARCRALCESDRAPNENGARRPRISP